MFLPGITFTSSRPTASTLSSRADVAMFVGCVGRRAAPLPEALKTELEQGGWSAQGLFRVEPGRLEALLDVPVPVESWSAFDALFEWERRPSAPGSGDMLPTPLGLAVKSFFAEGGARAYVVRTGDPMPLIDPEASAKDFAAAERRLLSWTNADPPPDADARAPILPGFESRGRGADPADPATWSGAASIYAVDDAAMLVIPDLIDICAGAPQPVPLVPEPPGPPEQFRPCAPAAPGLDPEERVARPEYRAPRLDADGYGMWARAIVFTLELLGRPKGPAHRRDVMLLSAFPLPLAESGFDRGEEKDPLALLNLSGLPLNLPGTKATTLRLLDAAAIGNARLQVAYPWVETSASRNLPEGLQSPEGPLAGLIARTSLEDGAFRSAAGRPCFGARRLHPELGESEIRRGLPGGEADWMGELLCLIGEKRGRIEWLSDSTMAFDRKWRAGGVSRLMGIILRAARTFGDDLMFEPSGPALWARIRSTVEGFLEGLRQRGALDGRTSEQAYEVRCDESSMTQADIDSGRVICRIAFTAAYPIQHIIVSLLLLEAPETAAARKAA